MVVQKVAFQGEPGAYSEMAAFHFFPTGGAPSCKIVSKCI